MSVGLIDYNWVMDLFAVPSSFVVYLEKMFFYSAL